MKRVAENAKAKTKPAVGIEFFIFLTIFVGIFLYLGKAMGAVNMLNTMMNTGYQLLMDAVLYILAIAVLAGAISGLFTEFGVVELINKILSPLMKPLYALPGASIIGVLATYLSDNPAILTLTKQTEFKRYFKKYQFPALIGNLGAVIGSIVSVRIMLFFTAKIFGKEESCVQSDIEHQMGGNEREIRSGSLGNRILGAILDGGKSGVDMGRAIIPGVVVICTLVMMLTNGPSASGAYTGAAYEGSALLPALGDKLRFILEPLFGFTSSKGVAVPITALGAAGAAIGLVPKMVQDGIAVGNDIAVFTAMCMCWCISSLDLPNNCDDFLNNCKIPTKIIAIKLIV